MGSRKQSLKANKEQLWEVESIVKERVNRGRKQYLVKWRGFPSSQNTWETDKSFEKRNVILNAWKTAQRAKMRVGAARRQLKKLREQVQALEKEKGDIAARNESVLERFSEIAEMIGGNPVSKGEILDAEKTKELKAEVVELKKKSELFDKIRDNWMTN